MILLTIFSDLPPFSPAYLCPKMKSPSLDIILPCYNPGGDWTSAILKSYSKIHAAVGDTLLRIIIVNDGSTINLEPQLRILKEKIPNLLFESYAENKGKGYALRKGVSLSSADVIIYTDIDFPYEETGLLKIFENLRDNFCDVSVTIRDENYYKHVPAARKLLSKILKGLIRFTLNVPTTDTQAGLKGFNQKGKAVFLKTTIHRYLFDLEFIFLCGKQKDIRLECIPVKVKNDIRFTKMNWRVLLTEGFNFLKLWLFSRKQN